MIIDAAYTEKVSTAQQNSSYPYTRVTRLSYQQMSKKDTTWLLDIKLQVKSLQGLIVLFLEDQTDFAYKVENFYNSYDQESKRYNRRGSSLSSSRGQSYLATCTKR